MHVDHLGASSLAIINNWWHMPRTKAVFGHVFQVPPFPQDSGPYNISWFEVGDGLRPEVLKLRLDKENATLPRFLPGGHWQAETSTLPELHKWWAIPLLMSLLMAFRPQPCAAIFLGSQPTILIETNHLG